MGTHTIRRKRNVNSKKATDATCDPHQGTNTNDWGRSNLLGNDHRNFLLPLAAEYRAAFSNWSIRTVWIDSLPVGMIIGCCVSYALLRFFEKIPTRDPILKSVILSFIALVIATILIDVPRSFLLPGSDDSLYYFLIGVTFNAARFLFLGLVIGYLYKRLYGSTRT